MLDALPRLNAALSGRYRVERQLGEGGMATVYLADDLRHGRKVALKVLKPELAAVVGAERFLAEIRTTANLQHPHILPLHDSGEADGLLFYVMPFIEGETLRDRLDRVHQLPVDEAVRIATNVAEALDYAHRRGVIHRDVKPANILLVDGKPVVADFGIALAVSSGSAGRMTETGLSLGTPHYMSPEQATGDAHVGPATDIWALGCVLYEMLAGEPPYTGSTPQSVLGKIITAEPPSVAETRKSVPANVDAAIRKALEKVPADRFSVAGKFAEALGDPSVIYRASAAPHTSKSTRRWTPSLVIATAIATVSTLTLVWLFTRPESGPSVARHILGGITMGGPQGPIGRRAAIAPDGSSMILPIGTQLGLKMRASTETMPIPDTEGARDVTFSPNGEWIAYSIGTDLFKRLVTGGSPIRIADDLPTTTGVVGLSWLEDGTILYEQYGVGDGPSTRRVVQISEDGGDPLRTLFGTLEEVAISWIHGLPGAHAALIVACPGTLCPVGEGQVHFVDLETGDSKILLEGASRAWYVRTGHIVYVRGDGAVLGRPFDPNAKEFTGPERPLFEGVLTFGSSSALAEMQLGSDGTVLYMEDAIGAGAELQLLEVDLEGNATPLGLRGSDISEVTWSPDGRTVAYVSGSQIHTWDVIAQNAPRQITFEGIHASPQFSPDGRRLAFVQESAESGELLIKNLGDAAAPTAIIRLDLLVVLHWPTDSTMMIQYGRAGEQDLATLRLDGSGSATVVDYLSTAGIQAFMSVSPDGSLAAYQSNLALFVSSFPTAGQPTALARLGNASFWGRDSNTVYYARSEGGGQSFFVARLRRDPVPVVQSTDSMFTVASVNGPVAGALHPDGDRFILAQAVGGQLQRRVILIQNLEEELRRVLPR